MKTNYATNLLTRPSDSPAMVEPQMLDRRYVHKHNPDNVYVRRIDKVGDDRYVSHFALPSLLESTLRDGSLPHRNILLYSEAARQSSMALCHLYFGVPFDVAFVITDLAARLSDEALSVKSEQDTEKYAAQLRFEIQILFSEYDKEGRLTTLTIGHRGLSGDTLLIEGEAHLFIQGHYRYERMRNLGRRRFERNYADKLGTARDYTRHVAPPPKGSLLTGLFVKDGGGVALLHVDEDNPFFFDHKNDHLPGMLLLEAAREMAVEIERREANRIVKSASIEFSNFAEHHYPIRLEATRPDMPGSPFLIEATQGEGNVLSTCLITTKVREDA